MQDEYAEAFQRVLAEARTVAGISDIERTEHYEPLKTIVYDMLKSGMDHAKTTAEAVSWLRQNVQIRQSLKRLRDEE